MADRLSRHKGLNTYRRPITGLQQDIELYEPRLPAETDADNQPRTHTVRSTDRLDLLANQYLDDPHQYWRFIEANRDIDVDDLDAPGRTIRLPQD